jgi:tRNA(adenine34) deaminase
MQAITSAAQFLGGKYLTDCTLYVTLEPCVMCAGALGWAQISKIVYGVSDQKRGFQRFARAALHPKTEIVAGVLEMECSKLVTDFFKMKRLKCYWNINTDNAESNFRIRNKRGIW